MYGGFKPRTLQLNWHLFMHKVLVDLRRNSSNYGVKRKKEYMCKYNINYIVNVEYIVTTFITKY